METNVQITAMPFETKAKVKCIAYGVLMIHVTNVPDHRMTSESKVKVKYT